MSVLKITFQKENSIETRDIYYSLLNNSVVNKLKILINDINSQEFVETRYNNFCIHIGNLKNIKNAKYKELQDNIRLFENENNNGYLFTYNFELKDISQEKLNLIHSEFENKLIIFIGEAKCLTNENNLSKQIELDKKYNTELIIRYLNNINNIIHNLESIISFGDSETISTGYFTTYLYSEPYMKNIKFDEDEYKLFSVDTKWGDLLLGYGTTGKSLYHVFKDNDISLLENMFNLSPQEYVTPNIMGIFSETNENHNEDFKKWCVDNNLKEKYGIDVHDIKNASGYIKIGNLLYEGNDKERFLMNLSEYKNIIGYRIL